MLDKCEAHEVNLANGCMRQRRADRKRRGISFHFLFKFKRTHGRWLGGNSHHLNKKRMKCYPRGKVLERLIEIEFAGN